MFHLFILLIFIIFILIILSFLEIALGFEIHIFNLCQFTLKNTKSFYVCYKKLVAMYFIFSLIPYVIVLIILLLHISQITKCIFIFFN